MNERAAGWGSWRARAALALAAGAALTSSGCLSAEGDSLFEAHNDPEYQLGGQTGSLLPRCGVAPLSAEGQSVPAGRALAVFYSKDCPELAAAGRLALAGVALTGVALEAQPLELVPLAADTYLVQAAQSVPAGDYQLQLGEQAESELSVAGELEVPSRFGELRASTAAECPDVVRFTLELDEPALALTPLARFDVSIDGGSEQLWVDYGALRLESDGAGTRGVLELPRCGALGCLEPGPHHLQVRVRLAGQGREPEPMWLEFEPCPSPEVGEAPNGEGCALLAPERAGRTSPSWGVWALVLGLAGYRRWRAGD